MDMPRGGDQVRIKQKEIQLEFYPIYWGEYKYLLMVI